jgi:hypothetical protein
VALGIGAVAALVAGVVVLGATRHWTHQPPADADADAVSTPQ